MIFGVRCACLRYGVFASLVAIGRPNFTSALDLQTRTISDCCNLQRYQRRAVDGTRPFAVSPNFFFRPKTRADVLVARPVSRSEVEILAKVKWPALLG